ncbi:DUF3291 domain-containing protein [Chitinimonas arctica]|uniref:DUF3291 domain-containing protein n=1 Tax=Chitinimonas arctica TaxID=2594795 RepID=A0A516SLR6_9NEIS|nr:DUF3291 domain-containing protein [Chitinimonas arctica]QDQ28978.1 DUF3291 domain-containing protein [Chitinimonas arctica]
MQPKFHLAQVNIGKAKAPMDQPVMKGFADQLDSINALAERSPGFVWRLKTEAGDATDIQLFEDPLLLVNMSVWESLEDLQKYVYTGDHLQVLKDRKQWFDKFERPVLALWWIPAGYTPTGQEARERLEQLWREGPSPAVFSFAKPFPMPTSDVTEVVSLSV